MTEAADSYHDDITHPDSARALWAAVLHQTVNDAIHGVYTGSGGANTVKARLQLINEARRYLTTPSRDFDEVCTLAGLDPEAVRDHAIRLIAAAPPPEELTSKSAGPPKRAKRLTYDGRTLTISEWSKVTGLPVVTIGSRIRRGWTTAQTLTLPSGVRKPTLYRETPGVSDDFAQVLGTGAGSTAQETTNIDFHKDIENADCNG